MAYKQLLYTVEKTKVLWLYATRIANGETSFGFVEDVAGGTNYLPLGTLPTNKRLAWVSWENKVYFSNLDINLTRLKGKEIENVNTSENYVSGTSDLPEITDKGYREVRAKYMVASDDHLMLGNLVVDGNTSSLILIWSDLYDPDLFVIDSSTEAGYYVMPAQGKEIMGLSFCQGYTNIFTRTGIKSGRYVGYANGIYEFTDIPGNTGCGYHYSVVAGKDLTFFIGNDNFYVLDGNTVQPIGDAIWKLFKATLDTSDLEVVGEIDETKDLVYWRFLANGENGTVSETYYELLYNYKEQKWSLRDSEGILDNWESSESLVTAITCDTLNVPCSYYVSGISPRLCSEFVNEFSFSSLFLTEGSFLEESETTKDGVNGAGREFFLETKDFTFSITDTSVRFNSVRLICDHSEMLGSEASLNESYLEVAVGYRNNLAGDFTWTEYVQVASGGKDEREILFRFRKYNITGKIFKLRVRAKHMTSSFLKVLSSCQFSIEVPDEQSSSYVTR
jgi:hypothetical protein